MLAVASVVIVCMPLLIKSAVVGLADKAAELSGEHEANFPTRINVRAGKCVWRLQDRNLNTSGQ